MLEHLKFENVGPADRLEFGPLAPRLNLITGDNGLGKSFLLETAWWALTRTWHEIHAVPSSHQASISFGLDTPRQAQQQSTSWDRTMQRWGSDAFQFNKALVVYGRLDGSFSVWDPLRYSRERTGVPGALQFTAHETLHGLRQTARVDGVEHEQLLCPGLIADWVRWQDRNDPRYDLLCRLLSHIGPDGESLSPGSPAHPLLDDRTPIPTIKMANGQEVPITYAPAGVKRMATLAYLLAWTFSVHQEYAERMAKETVDEIIVLLDEPETHLHPRWQRTVLPSLAQTIAEWGVTPQPRVQYLIATHSPLVLASMEPIFDPAQDALWKLDLVDGEVKIEKDQWRLRGDVNRWLVSDVFDLGAASSPEAEAALSEAQKLIVSAAPNPADVRRVTDDLLRLLPEMDPFFVRWRYYMQKHLDGGAP